MALNEDQRVGMLIVLIAVVLIGVLLVCSHGWGLPTELWLFRYVWEFEPGPGGWQDAPLLIVVRTKYFLGVLLLVAGYGLARFLSIIPPIFRGTKNARQGGETRL